VNGSNKRTRRRVARGESSRSAMRARRAKPPVVNPAASGQTGGQYAPLSDAECAGIYGAALNILEDIGMGDAPAVLIERAVERGALLSDRGRLCFPASMVDDCVAGAAKCFTFHGRDSRHDIEVGGSRVFFGTGGAAVQTLDLDSGLYRGATLTDLYDFARLCDTLSNVSWFTRCCVATDVPDVFELDVNTAYALLRGTTKPIGTSFTLAEHVDPIVDMFDAVLGGEGEFAKRPFCKAHISPVISPLRYGEDAVDVTLACIKRRVPINAIIAAQSGATAPATLAGMLAQTLAEALAGLLLVNVFEPGYPTIFSNWPLVIDLRSGSFSGGGGEAALLNAASAQLSNWLGLPSGVACSMADAKAVDAQMGMAKAITALATGLAGANMVYESAGMSASLLGASFEAFVIDDEMLSNVNRLLRGVEVTDENIGLDAIEAAVFGEGHFLGSDQTLAAMERDYFYPTLADRDDPTSWAERGAEDLSQRANAKARSILADHHPDYIDAAVDEKIRQRFSIHLAKKI